MAHNRHARRSTRLQTYRRRARRWFTIGSAIVGVMYAIDPNWPTNLRRLVLTIAIWIRGSLGCYRGCDR
jgi:hypothetical protein